MEQFAEPDFTARKRGPRPRIQAPPNLRDSPDAPDRDRRNRRNRRDRRNRLAKQLMFVAAVWSLGLVIAALVLPVYNGETIDNANGVSFTTETIVAGQGAWVLIPVAVPLVLCGVVALALRRRRAGADTRRSRLVAWAAIALLSVFSVLSIPSIGLFVIPAVVLLARAITLTAPGPGAAAPTVPDRAPRALRG